VGIYGTLWDAKKRKDALESFFGNPFPPKPEPFPSIGQAAGYLSAHSWVLSGWVGRSG